MWPVDLSLTCWQRAEGSSTRRTDRSPSEGRQTFIRVGVGWRWLLGRECLPTHFVGERGSHESISGLSDRRIKLAGVVTERSSKIPGVHGKFACCHGAGERAIAAVDRRNQFGCVLTQRLARLIGLRCWRCPIGLPTTGHHSELFGGADDMRRQLCNSPVIAGRGELQLICREGVEQLSDLI